LGNKQIFRKSDITVPNYYEDKNNGQFTQWLFAYILNVTATYTLEGKIYEIQQRKIKHILCPQYFFISLIFSALNKSRYTKI
jgi:hypothetical protein